MLDRLTSALWKDDYALLMAVNNSPWLFKGQKYPDKPRREALRKGVTRFQIGLKILAGFPALPATGVAAFPRPLDVTVTGVYDERTEASVNRAKTQLNFTPDGRAGRQTLKALDAKLEQIEDFVGLTKFLELVRNLTPASVTL